MKTILIIDDNEGYRDILKDSINRSFRGKYRFLEASDPLEALNLFNKNQKYIDLVICDFFMPIQNGDDFLEIIKQNAPHIHRLILSAKLEKTDCPHADKSFSKLDLNSLVEYLKDADSQFYKMAA